MKPALLLRLLIVLVFMMVFGRCGVKGPPIPYVKAHPEEKTTEEPPVESQQSDKKAE